MQGSVESWLAEEYAGVDIGDVRLNNRLVSILRDFLHVCDQSICSSLLGWANIKACYRFLSNPKVCFTSMLAPHINSTLKRIRQESTVLLLQDSTYLDYNNRPGTKGLDLTFRKKSSKASTGLILHNTLAITTGGLPLGLLDQRFVNRKAFSGKNYEEKRKNRYWNKPIEQKESVRWVDVVRKCAELDLSATTNIIHVADRECDMYEFYRDCVQLNEQFIVRAARNRSINKLYRREMPSEYLFDLLTAKRAQGRTTINFQVNGKKKYRDATLSVIFSPVGIAPPPNKTKNKDGENLPILSLNAIMAIEKKPPKSQSPLLWVLLTNQEVSSLAQAIETIQRYSLRWNIETFHKVLKSGCAVEKAQLRTADSLKKYVVLKSIVAWRLFWLSRLHEEQGDQSCEAVLAPNEWKLLYRKIHKTPPTKPPTVSEAHKMIAQLGGYIGRTTDPPPGVISTWRGCQRLMNMIEDYNDLCG